MLHHHPIAVPVFWQEALGRVGFQWEQGRYQRDRFVVGTDGGWMTLEDTAACPPGNWLRDSIDDRGYWKWVRVGGRPSRVFELPVSAFSGRDRNMEDNPGAVEQLLRWALESAGGSPIPTGWRADYAAQLPEWLASESLTIQRSGYVRQGCWLARSDRLTARLPVLLEVPTHLTPERLAWLEALLHDAQDRWRLVRFGFVDEAGHEMLVAAVDLTGAPLSRRMISTSLEALRFGVAWLVESAELLADMRVASKALAVLPVNPQTRKEHSA